MAGHRFLDRCNHLKKNDKEVVLLSGPKPLPEMMRASVQTLVFLCRPGLVATVYAVPGLRVADDESVSCSV